MKYIKPKDENQNSGDSTVRRMKVQTFSDKYAFLCCLLSRVVDDVFRDLF